MTKLHIFLGKEGSGKSTCAAMDSMRSSMNGQKTLLESLDQFKSLDKIFQVAMGKRDQRVLSNLVIKETNLREYSRDYLAMKQKELKKMIRSKSARTTHDLRLLQSSPGLDEMSMLLIMQDAVNSHAYDDIMLDTLSPYLTLKALTLPKINSYWLESLLMQRADILAKKAKLGHAEMGISSVIDDPVYKRLQELKEQYHELMQMLSDPETTEFVLVLNPDTIQIPEARDIRENLQTAGLDFHRIVLNKCQPGSTWPDEVATAFPDTYIEIVSAYPRPIAGVEQLSKVSQQIYNYIRA